MTGKSLLSNELRCGIGGCAGWQPAAGMGLVALFSGGHTGNFVHHFLGEQARGRVTRFLA